MGQTRRDFIKSSVLASSAIALGFTNNISAVSERRIKFGGFTKELQSLSYDETAEAVLKMGWDGIECPVRPGGHVLPERVEEDLPKIVEALKKRDLELQIMATDIHNPSEEYTERILRTANKLGIKYYRLGWWNYDLSKSLQPQLDNIKSQLKELAALNEELGIIGVYQNHSGTDSVGAPVWDIYELLSAVDSQFMGCHFDIGHATVEGGYAWQINYERIKKFIKAVIVKDFKWSYSDNQYGKVEWCPIGTGMINPEFFELLKKSEFNGPVTMHFEYHVEGEGREKINNLIAVMTKDGNQIKKWLSQ